jgi:DNA-directed RNA polymerase subunit alpha
MPVEQLDLSVRTMNCLRRSNITTVGELIGKGTKELLKLRNFGQKSYQEIEDRLASIGLSLNPKVEQEKEDKEESEDIHPGSEKTETVEMTFEEPHSTGETPVSDEEKGQEGEPQL